MTHGMVCAPQPEAVEAGALVLKAGGNAVDAAIATAFMQGVVDPQMAGIAGFGTMQVYLPGRGVHECIDFHGKCPASARPDMWADLLERETRDGFGFILQGRVNEVGYQSITVPGSLKAYADAAARWGRLDWAELIAPAIAEAEAGFVVRPRVHQVWTEDESAIGRIGYGEKLAFSVPGRRIYFREDGTLRRPGERVPNPDMARTLRRIAEGGAEIFYEGEIASEIAADMAAHGGLITLDDLKGYRTTTTEPLWGEYRGRRIATCQPPGGGVMVIEMLNVLEEFDLTALGHNTPDYIRVFAEAMKYATIDKDRHVGDPAFVDVPLARLTGKGYAAELAERIRRGEKAHVERAGAEPRHTTQICVVDGDGNAVTMTHSLGSPSGVISEGLGFMYNGCMAVFDPRPGRAGSIAPGKSRFASMAPTIVFEGDRPHIVLGAPGGTHITLAVTQAIVNVLDFGMSMLEAVAAPRFSATSDVIDVSNRIPRFVTRELQAMGYPINRSYQSYAFAGVHGIRIDGGRWSGGADPQRDGMALAV